jgi:hypothetical protein
VEEVRTVARELPRGARTLGNGIASYERGMRR